MKPVEFLYLSQEDVIAAGGLDMDGTLATLEEAFRLWGLEDVVQPTKSAIRWGPPAVCKNSLRRSFRADKLSRLPLATQALGRCPV